MANFSKLPIRPLLLLFLVVCILVCSLLVVLLSASSDPIHTEGAFSEFSLTDDRGHCPVARSRQECSRILSRASSADVGSENGTGNDSGTGNTTFRPVILVSLDGFRFDYLQKEVSPTLWQMLHCGVSTPRVKPAFPSKTFPNHYSIATGLYPESSGIVGNMMRDPTLPGRKFRIGKSESLDPIWWQGEPVWQTVQRTGAKSAVFFWPGSEVAGAQPDYYRQYDGSVPFEKRIRQAVDWLLLPESKRPRFIAVYLNEPDTSGHKYGPESSQVKEAVSKVDKEIGLLLHLLKSRDLLGCVDVIVTSDHGMTSAMTNGVCDEVILDQIVPGLSNMTSYIDGPIARLRPHNTSQVDPLIARLDCKHPALRVMKREHLPFRWHFWRNQRIEPIVAQVDEGFSMAVHKHPYCQKGNHGYDNDLLTMQNIFVGYGPSFKQNYTTPPFENIQIRSLLDTLLELPDIALNSTRHSLDHLLIDPPKNLTSVGSEPKSGRHIADVSKTVCCDSSGKCQCESLNNWMKLDAKLISRSRPYYFPLPHDSLFEERRSELLVSTDLIGALDAGSTSYRWFQYNIRRGTSGTFESDSLTEKVPDNCIVTLTESDTEEPRVCMKNLTSLYLTPVGFQSRYQTLRLTQYNINKNFDRILHRMRAVISEYFKQYAYVTVLTGPLYLSPTTGYSISPNDQPSHVFIQLRMCKRNLCRISDTLHKQWIFPIKASFSQCEDSARFVQFHEVSLNDLSMATGLVFYAGMPVSNPDNLERSHAYFSTQLPDIKPPVSWALH